MNILLVGAYERDNFGDALFCILTQHILHSYGHKTTLSSVIAHPKSYLGNISSYDRLLQTESFDVIWIVGGELSGVDVSLALTMSLPDDVNEWYLQSGEAERLSIRSTVGAPRNPKSLAYIPNPKFYNSSAKLVINSSGMASPGGIPNDTIEDELRDICKDAHCVSVRDIPSRILISKYRNTVLLAPDLIHALPKVLPQSINTEPYLVFQIDELLFNSFKLSNLVNILEWVSICCNFSIKLLPSGLARHHDSLMQYKQLKNSLTVPVELIIDRHPLHIANIIANSSLWIGSSLHGRVVAESFQVPRISFKSAKVTTYSSLWDPIYPYNVDLSNFASTVECALTATRSRSNLCDLAYSNIEGMINSL